MQIGPRAVYLNKTVVKRGFVRLTYKIFRIILTESGLIKRRKCRCADAD